MKTAWKEAALLAAVTAAVGGLALDALLRPEFVAALVRMMAFCYG